VFDPSSNLVARVRSFNRFYTNRIGLLDEQFLRSPLSLSEARILYELSQKPGARAIELRKYLNLDKGYLSRVLKRFQHSGLVAKHPSNTDGRSILLMLTRKGQKTIDLINRSADTEVVKMLQTLSAEKQEQLSVAMDTIEGLLASSLKTVRLAVPSEAISISSLLSRTFAEFLPFYTPRAYAVTTPTAGQIRKRWSEGPMWVALINGQIVGTVSAVTKDEGLYIRSTGVVPEARDQGLGRMLLTQVEEFAKSQQVRRMFLSTTPFLTGAIRLYEKFGFQCSGNGPHDLFGTPLFTMEKFLF